MDFTFISKTALFRGCQEKEIKQMVKHLNFKTVCYKKKDVIFSNGDTVTDIGLVLSGSVQIEHNAQNNTWTADVLLFGADFCTKQQ